MTLSPMDYQRAIDVQDACNISGVIESLHAVLKSIRDTAHVKGHGTDWINEHPIIVMYASKIYSLSHADEYFSESYRQCRENCMVLNNG